MLLRTRHCQALCAWLLASGSVVSCASVQNQQANTRSFYAFAGAGVTQFDTDTQGGSLVVEEDTDLSLNVGVGYQFNSVFAGELRVADLGEVEFNDGLNLGFQLFDATGLIMLRGSRASLFGQLGIGTFGNSGDFDVDLVNPVHPVIGGGVFLHATRNLDFRFSVSTHNVDATWGKLDVIWRFGSPGRRPSASVVTDSSDVLIEQNGDGFTSIEPVETPPVIPPVEVRPVPAPVDNGLPIDQKLIPTLQTVPEPQPVIVPEVELISGQGSDFDTELTVRNTGNVVAEPNRTTVPVEAPVQTLFAEGTVLPVGPFQFELGGFELSDATKTDLDGIVGLLRANPTISLTVEAHASPVGDPELNMLLSRRRALSVIRYLVDGDVAIARLRPEAFGDTTPVPNATSIDISDRVELRVR